LTGDIQNTLFVIHKEDGFFFLIIHALGPGNIGSTSALGIAANFYIDESSENFSRTTFSYIQTNSVSGLIFRLVNLFSD
jgi:hypothetical protein